MKRTVEYQGEKVTGTLVSFSNMKQDWNEYFLTDGTTLRVQAVVVEIVRVDGKYGPQGDPIYSIHCQNIVTISNVGEFLRKEGGSNSGEGNG